jgi:cobalt-zinc-cadmium efflux system protein
MSFGYHRTEVLAALANALLILGIAAYLMVQAYERYLARPQVSSGLMFLIGLAGLGANLVMLALLRGWSKKNINVRGAFLHTYGDAIGSAGVVVGALLIQTTGNVLIDPFVALVVASLLVVSGIRLLRDSVRIVLEASPAGLTPEAVAAAISSYPGIRGIHDLHIWTVTSGFLALTGHVLVAGDRTVQEATKIVDGVEAILRERFGIAHATLQVDSVQTELISSEDVQRTT